MSRRPYWPIFLCLATAVLVVDQLVKGWLVATIDPGESIPIVGDLVRLIHTRNSGAVFGLFRDNALLFGAASVIVVGLIVVFHARSARSAYLSVTLGLLLGGALGNLVDRFRLGYVIDFVDAGIGTLRFYTFNVADAAISLSVLMLILVAIRPSLAEPRPPAATGSEERGPDPEPAGRRP